MRVRHIIVLFFPVLFFAGSAKDVSGAVTDSSGISYPSRLVGDTITFSGYEWIVKDSREKTIGPGKNYFSSNSNNVWTDSLGRLHLRMTYRDEKWLCPEVHLLHSLGAGDYVFQIEGNGLELDKDVVIGIFLYDYSSADKNHNELDIEISKWGKEKNINTQYVVQPDVDKAFRFDCDLQRTTIHSISVGKRTADFLSRYAVTNDQTKNGLIAQKKMRLRKAYQPEADRACINVWLYKASEPTNLREFEVVVSKFEFSPAH